MSKLNLIHSYIKASNLDQFIDNNSWSNEFLKLNDGLEYRFLIKNISIRFEITEKESKEIFDNYPTGT
jgi:hypothetical protein